MPRLVGFTGRLAPFVTLASAAPQPPVTPGKDPATNQSPTINVTTRLVQVMAIVRDKRGAVDGLTKNDFTVLDNGRPRQISVFSEAKASDHVAESSCLPAALATS